MTFTAITAQQRNAPSFPLGVLRGGPLVAGVEVSIMVSESHTLSAQVTQQALESGAQVSDHVIINPESVSVTYEVANSGDGPGIAKDVFETFKNMLDQRKLMELVTEHYVYDNMVLVGLTPLHSAPCKGRLQCTATLQRVNQVKIETVGREPAALPPGSPTQKTASSPVKAGTQAAEPPSKSLLARILDTVNKSKLNGREKETQP